MNDKNENIFKWSDKYSLEIDEIDNQHKKLFDIAFDLDKSFKNKTSGKKIKTIIEQLLDYSNYHFATEEKYFNQFNYEDKEIHIYKHKEFVNKIEKLKSKINGNELAVTYQLLNFLRNWLIDHLRDEDIQYKDCFLNNGLK